MDDYPHPLTVEGIWPSTSSQKTLRNKLQVYFQSKKKSRGGDCVVKFSEQSSAATVFFKHSETRDQVLAKGDHSITIDKQSVKLKVFKSGDEGDQTEEARAAAGTQSDVAGKFRQSAVQRVLDKTDHSIYRTSVSVHPYFGPDDSQRDHSTEEPRKDSLRDPPPSSSVLLEKLPDNFSRDILVILVEIISGVPQEEFVLELKRESNVAVVTFNDPKVVTKFLKESQNSKKFQQYGLTCRALEKSRIIKVDNVPGQCTADLLELYFEKWGGDVERITMIPEKQSATVTFHSRAAVQRVLDKTDHSICRTLLSVHPYFGPDESQRNPPTEEPLKDPPPSSSVVVEKLSDNFSRDVLVLLIENISDVPEEEFVLELIRESNVAVVTFNDPKVAEKFLPESRGNKTLQQNGLTSRALEKTRSIKVENVPDRTSTDLLVLYFEKWGGEVENVTMIPEEQAAIVTFCSEGDVKRVLGKDYCIGKTSLTIYPYFMSLGSALYGKDRPTWTLPKPYTEKIHPAIREFLCKKGLISAICKQMESVFCQVNMDKDEVQLSPLPALLKQKNITKKHIDSWKQNSTNEFRDILSNCAVFEHAVIPSMWSKTEKDIRSVVKDKAFVSMDDGLLTLAGMAEDIKLLQPILENVLRKASDQMDRDRNSVSESIVMSPAMYSLFLHEGLQNTALGKYPELKLIYNNVTNQLTLRGLPMEIIDIKNWILEKKLSMKKKTLKMDPSLLEFLRSVNCEEMSEDLFTSKGICAVCKVENRDVVLIGSTDRALTEAETRLQMILASSTLSLEDVGVIEKPEWRSLCDQLYDTYNSAKKKTVVISHPDHRDRLIVSGFKEPVSEVSRSLEKFINMHSRIEEVIHVRSYAVVKFIRDKKAQVWQKLVKPSEVTVDFDPKRPVIRLSGERVHVQPATENFQKIADALHIDKVMIKKAGAKKYFQEQGNIFLFIMKEHRFVVILEESHMEQEQLDFVMATEEFEPAVFQLCAESQQDLKEARELITSFIVKEQMSSSIRDSAINHFTREDAETLTILQRELTVSIHLNRNGPEPVIMVEGLTRDVLKAENIIRDIIRKVEKNEVRRREALMISSIVEWQYLNSRNQLVSFDMYTNYDLEEALGKKQPRLKIKIYNEQYEVDLTRRVATGRKGTIELKRVDRKDTSSEPLPGHWEKMKENSVKRVPIQAGSLEYRGVENEFRRTGLANQIIKIERVQNDTLWKSYMIQKKHMDDKNKNKNNERKLFHGTSSDNIDKIDHRGFNRSYAGMHGAMIGNGVYFAVDPSYSARGYAAPDQQGHKRMYLARVLVGDYTRGRTGLLSPPAKSSSAIDVYDSVTDNQQNPTMFVIFHDVQAYPEYLITFLIRKVEKNEVRKRDALMISCIVEWQYLDSRNQLVSFDMYTNYDLEEALGKKQPRLKIKIYNEQYEVDLTRGVATGRRGMIELKRVDRRDTSSDPLPGNWEKMKENSVKRVQIQAGSLEYKDVENEFRRTGLANQILKMERVQNDALWKSYMIQKKHMDDKNSNKNNERKLFHGTSSDNIDKIDHRGFNRSYAGTHGAMIGNGVYFAVDPSYSARGYAAPDQQGHKRMYLARVLVGDYTTGRHGLLAPPAKSSSAIDVYDSVTDNQQNPTMFVIFHDVQAYPEYLITFL